MATSEFFCDCCYPTIPSTVCLCQTYSGCTSTQVMGPHDTVNLTFSGTTNAFNTCCATLDGSYDLDAGGAAGCCGYGLEPAPACVANLRLTAQIENNLITGDCDVRSGVPVFWFVSISSPGGGGGATYKSLQIPYVGGEFKIYAAWTCSKITEGVVVCHFPGSVTLNVVQVP